MGGGTDQPPMRVRLAASGLAAGQIRRGVNEQVRYGPSGRRLNGGDDKTSARHVV
jgi:hypothetical protein